MKYQFCNGNHSRNFADKLAKQKKNRDYVVQDRSDKKYPVVEGRQTKIKQF